MFARRRLIFATLLGATLGAAAATATAQSGTPRKRIVPVVRPQGPPATSQDVGNVAVLVDNGLMVTRKNAFDLAGRVVRFDPAGTGRFMVSSSPGALEPEFGPALTFGFPGTLYPGDDDAQEVAFPAGFPFFGSTYTSVWVNTDGNVTFGAPEFASDDRDKSKHVSGPPRISGFLNDWSPQNALNPMGQGSVHATVKTGPDRLVVTWNGVTDWNFGGTSSFQVILYSTGVAAIALIVDPVSVYGVSGIAAGYGAGPIQQVDLSTGQSSALPAGAVFEAFAPYVSVSEVQIAREFYTTHPDKFDFLAVLTDFNTDGLLYSHYVSNHTHGIGTPLEETNGQPWWGTEYDFTAARGSAGELENVVYMNNVYQFWQDAERLVNPPVQPYSATSNIIQIPERFGWPVSFDGQTMTQVRIFGTMPQDDGELSRYYARGGQFSNWTVSPMAMMGKLVERRWGTNSLFVHPTKGVGFDSYDLLGRGLHFWSFFMNTATPGANFPDAPRYSGMEGNHIVDLGTQASWNGTATNLAAGERLFWVPDNQLCDGYCMLDLHLMGLIPAAEVGPYFYVDEPRSIFTGQELDPFDPGNPLATAVTMRCWGARGGMVFKGKRVDLTIDDIQAYEKLRERHENPRGKRFWGPRGNLAVRYFTDTRRVDPNGNASITLSESARELGDEADMIDQNGKPVDVKTMAFILVVQSGAPLAHGTAISRVDSFRQTWQAYANGPATGGRGRFDTVLTPAIY
jgi:hypothetical protein